MQKSACQKPFTVVELEEQMVSMIDTVDWDNVKKPDRELYASLLCILSSAQSGLETSFFAKLSNAVTLLLCGLGGALTIQSGCTSTKMTLWGALFGGLVCFLFNSVNFYLADRSVSSQAKVVFENLDILKHRYPK